MILAIDPGPTDSGYALYHGGSVSGCGVLGNEHMLAVVESWGMADGNQCAIEMIASYGMAVGREVFETCVWIGRFQQMWRNPKAVRLIYRKDVKLHLCGSPRAKDTNIRQALIDKLGAPGTKKAPGPTYGVKSHAWPALAVAVTASET